MNNRPGSARAVAMSFWLPVSAQCWLNSCMVVHVYSFSRRTASAFDFAVSALGSGPVDLRSLVRASDDGPYENRSMSFFADNQTSGVGTIDLSSFTNLTDQNPSAHGL